MADSDDYRYMAQALRLAEKGLYTTDPNPRVGCVLVKNNEVVGKGWHERAGEPHAEIMALRNAGEKASGAVAYISLEPCCHHGRTPPCSEALIEAGISRAVVAMEDPNPQVAGKGVAQLRDAGIEVDVGILNAQAEALNPGFIRRMQQGRPFVRCKLAMSLDGRTAMASGESQWITSEAARQDAHRLRARSSAIITGIGTVLSDNPSMNARIEQQEIKQPVRIVLDSRLSMKGNEKMIGLPGKAVICTTSKDKDKVDALESAGIEVVQLDGEDSKVSLPALMDYLNEQQFNEVLIEAGGTLSGAFVRSGLVDELIVYLAPTLLGDQARGLLSLPGLEKMEDRIDLDIVDIKPVGKDWRITAKIHTKT